jgi:hypothetical protein
MSSDLSGGSDSSNYASAMLLLAPSAHRGMRVVRTLGVDLASQSGNTATCEIEWADGLAKPLPPMVGVTDQGILDQAGRCDVIGIDAPFGWPQPFVEFLDRTRSYSQQTNVWSETRRDSLRFRRTDFRVREVLGRWPLSVSSDLIAITAMRCAGLLNMLEVVDCSGDGHVFEVYPAVALAAWGLPSKGYKDVKGRGMRIEILDAIEKTCPWLVLSPAVSHACTRDDHSLDALISSLVARAAAVGVTRLPIDTEERSLAEAEGWIGIPMPGSLPLLLRS